MEVVPYHIHVTDAHCSMGNVTRGCLLYTCGAEACGSSPIASDAPS